MQLFSLNGVLWPLIFLFTLLASFESQAVPTLWQGTTNAWGTAANWSNGIPTDIAEFGNSSLLTSPILSTNTTIAQLLFNANASSYTINTNGKTLTLTTGITNNSGQPQTITNSMPAKSTLTFQNGAIVGNNITINNVTSGSIIAFTGISSAADAKITNASGCTVDISGLALISPTIAIGSVSGAGAVMLGSKTLVTGALGLNDLQSGVISGVGGSLTKTGNGTLTLSGTNTYTGKTTISDGTLQMGKANSLASGTAVTTAAGATLNLVTYSQSIGSLAGDGNVALGSGTLTTGNDNTNTTFSGIASGMGGVTKVGTGTFSLSGSNTYTGATTINGGKLQATEENVLAQTSPMTVAAGATFDLNNKNQMVGSMTGAGNVSSGGAILSTGYANTNTTFSGVVSGTGGLTKVGTGTQTLSGTNTYSGPTTISGGTLRMGKANSLTTGTAVTVGAGTIFNLANFGQNIASLTGLGNVFLGSGILTTGNDNTNTVYSGVISGTGGLTKGGTGLFTLSGVNTFTGGTIVNAGTLQTAIVNALASTGAVTVGAGATLDLNNLNQRIGSLAGAGNVTLGTAVLTTGSTSTTTFSGVISGSGGLTKVGTGIFTLAGTNTFTGPTIISAGTLQTDIMNALVPTAPVTVTGTFKLANFDQTIGSLTGAGSVKLGTAILTTGNDDTNTIYSGAMTGGGGLTKVGSGVFTLSGANTYTGPTRINFGTLKMGRTNGLSTETDVTAGVGTTFDLANYSQSIGSLGGFGNVTLGRGTLTTGSDNTNTTYFGVISGTGGLTKVGTGTFSLSKNNTFTGTTTINGGTLQATIPNVLVQNKPVSVAAGATFDLNNNDQSIGSLSGAGNATLGSATLTTGYANTNTTFSGIVSGTGGLTKVGTGTQTLSGANTYLGPTTISGGSLLMGSANSLPVGSAVTTAVGTTFNLANFSQNTGSLAGSGNVVLGSGTLTTGNDNTNTTYSGVMSGTGKLTKTGTGNMTLSGINTYSGGTNIDNGTIIVAADNNLGAANTRMTFGTTTTAGTLQNTAAYTTTRPVTFNQGGGIFNTIGGNLTLSGLLSGPGSLTKQGNNILILSGANNTFSGGTFINGGSLQTAITNCLPQVGTVVIAPGTTLNLANLNQSIGSLGGSGTVTMGSATLTTGNDNANTTYSGVVSGTGGLTKVGTGIFSLSGNNSYTGATTINGGTLQAATSNVLWETSPVMIAAGAILDLNDNNQNIASLSGAGNVTLAGATLSTGYANTSTTFSGVVSGTGGLTKVGTGAFTLSGINTYTGPTTISAGTLQMGNANSLPAGSAVTTAAGTTFNLANYSQNTGSLAGSGNVNLGIGTLTTGNDNTNTTYSGVMSGMGRLTKAGSGTLTLSGINIYSGGTHIDNGTVVVAVDNNLGATNAPLTLGSVGSAGALQNTTAFTSNRSITLNHGGGIFKVSGGNLTLNGLISGLGSFTKQGNNTLILSGANNSYLGGTFIKGGSLQTTTDNSLPQTGTVTVAGGATLNTVNNSQTIGSLSGSGNVILGTGTLTTGNDHTDTTFSGVMSGTGGFTKVGAGTQTLSGTNSYSGPTTIGGGTLQMAITNALASTTPVIVIAGALFDLNNYHQTIGSLSGAGNVNLGVGLLTAGSDNTDSTFSGVISGTGGFTKVGTGIMTLSGTNLFTGPTTINGGELQMGKANSIAMGTAVTVDSGATLNLAGYDQSIGSLNGSGSVTLGSGALTMGSDNTNTTFSGIISGTGGLVKTGTGTFTLLGNNTYFGGTIVSNGVLQGNTRSLQGGIAITQGGQLTFNQDVADGTFNGKLSGTGTLEKRGSRTLILSNSTSFTGPITIQAGTLLMNDAPPVLGAAVAMHALAVPNPNVLTIQSGSTLIGTGLIQQGVVNGGLVCVGNPAEAGFETLTLKNGYQGDGTLQFNLDNQGNNSVLVSSHGNIDLRQTSLRFSSPDFIKTMHTYDLVQVQNPHADSIIGPFKCVPNRVGKFIPELAYGPGKVQLSFDLQPTFFAAECPPGNDRNVANYLDQLSETSEGPLEQFIFQLESFNPSQRDDVFRQLNTASQASMSQSLGLGSLVVSMTQGRMRNLGNGGQITTARAVPVGFVSRGPDNRQHFTNSLTTNKNNEPAYHTTRAALVEENAYQVPFGKGSGGAWVQSFGISNQQKTTQGITGFGARSGGLLAGLDAQLPKTNLYVGASVGYGRGNVFFKQARGTSKVNSNLASVYSLYASKYFYLDAALAFGYNKYQNNRQLPTLAKTAISHHRGIEWTPHVGAGINVKFREVLFQPFASVDYLYLREGKYTEQNADFANLTVLSTRSSQWRNEAGMNVSKTFALPKGSWTLLGKLSYIRRQPHKSSSIVAGLAGQSTTFETQALRLKQNEISPGVGLKLNLKNGFFISARYDAELSSVSTVQEVGIKLGVAF